MQNAATRRNPEIVHKARVSIRRMRAALRVFGAVLARKTAVRRAQKALKRLGQALGEARDWDIVQARLLPERHAELAEAVGKDAMRRVARSAQLARARANTAASHPYPRLARALRAFRAEVGPGLRPSRVPRRVSAPDV